MDKMNGYELSRNWFDFCFENPELVCPNHTALYFFCIEHCNRLGWKTKFGLPMEMAKEAIGIKNYKTYAKTFKDLIEWGFIELIQKSKNQYSSNIIAIVKTTKAHTKALDKAMIKHVQKQSEKQVRGIVGIDKPINKEPITKNKGKVRTLQEKVLFNSIKTNFLKWYKYEKKKDYYFAPKDGKAIYDIIDKLKFSIKNEKLEPTDENITAIFQKLLKSNQDNWIKENLSLTIINSKYNEIISKITNSSGGLRARLIERMGSRLAENQ